MPSKYRNSQIHMNGDITYWLNEHNQYEVYVESEEKFQRMLNNLLFQIILLLQISIESEVVIDYESRHIKIHRYRVETYIETLGIDPTYNYRDCEELMYIFLNN